MIVPIGFILALIGCGAVLIIVASALVWWGERDHPDNRPQHDQ